MPQLTTIEVTTKELNLIRNHLQACQMYKNMDIPLGAVVWTETHEKLWEKIIRCYHL